MVEQRTENPRVSGSIPELGTFNCIENILVFMWPIACILEYFVVEKLATMLAFRLVNPKEDKPVFVTLAICSMIVCLMCPVMSLIATVLFAHPGNQVIAVWLQKFALNFPMALCWQIFFGGVFVRNLFTWVKKAIHHK